MTARLEDIGFYTLSNARTKQASACSPLWRCEIVLTDRCNFKCPYCRGLRPDLVGAMRLEQANRTLDYWIADGLKNVRFSGGEPTLYPHLEALVTRCKLGGVEHIAVSTNGSASRHYYESILAAGVNDVSVSLDGCCSSIGDAMSGVKGQWDRVVENIRWLAERTYVTVGMVFTASNLPQCREAVVFASRLGVADVRIIPAAQYASALTSLADLPEDTLSRLPILRYRIENAQQGRPVRGTTAHHRCALVLDDMAVAHMWHFPCIIYLREGGDPIGKVGPGMRQERALWSSRHEPWNDPICSKMCLDVCCDYNSTYARYH